MVRGGGGRGGEAATRSRRGLGLATPSSFPPPSIAAGGAWRWRLPSFGEVSFGSFGSSLDGVNVGRGIAPGSHSTSQRCVDDVTSGFTFLGPIGSKLLNPTRRYNKIRSTLI